MMAVRISAFLLAAFALNCAAAPTPVTIGGDRLVVDSPPGFSDALQLSSPRIQELAESITSASDRVLLFALTDADLRMFMVGDRPEFRRYMVISTPSRLERERVDRELFAQNVSDAMRDVGKAPATDDYLKHLNAQPDGRPTLLAELKREPEHVSIMLGARILVKQGTVFQDPQYRHILSTHTMLLVRGKVIQLVIYSNYDTPQDLDWIRSMTQRWPEDLARLNRR
jgi:hypothetical protein